MDAKYEALFTPWKVGNVEIKNRIVMCPMGGTSLFGWFELTGCHGLPLRQRSSQALFGKSKQQRRHMHITLVLANFVLQEDCGLV